MRVTLNIVQDLFFLNSDPWTNTGNTSSKSNKEVFMENV